MPRGTLLYRLAASVTAIAGATLVVLLAALPAPAAPPPAGHFVAVALPDSAAGRQVSWFLDASTRLPIGEPELRAHFTKAFLASPGASPREINDILRNEVGAGGLRLVGVILAQPGAIVATVVGEAGRELVLTFVVNRAGRIVSALLEPAVTGRPVTLPAPSGREAVGSDTMELIDLARRGRRVMLTRWYPATGARAVPLAAYASPQLSAILGLPPVRVHAHLGARARRGHLPVVLFSPGLGVSRVNYQALAEDLASHGYLVIAIDHAGEAPVQYAKGRIALTSAPTSIAEASAARLADMQLVVRRLGTMGSGPVADRRRVAAVGHSLGGSTAAALIRAEPTVRAGIDLDGTITGAAAQVGVRRPFLAMTSAGHWGHDPHLTGLLEHSPGPRLALEVAGFDHFSFSDAPVVAPGSLDPGGKPSARDIALQRAYVRAFLDRYVRGRRARLLEGPSRQWPQVRTKYRRRCCG